MHLRASVVIGIGIVLTSTAAAADTYYRYRDRSTGRDVFVNRLEQVPQKYRSQAKVVFESDLPKTAPGNESPVEIVPPATRTDRPLLRNAQSAPSGADELRAALSGKALLRDGPGVASAAVDTQLVSKGHSPLTAAERKSFRDLIVVVGIASIVAAIIGLVAWIVIIVTAARDGHPWWAVLIFLCSPLGYVYVFFRGGKGRRLWKALCTLGMLTPLLVTAVSVWRFYAWLQAVMLARGGKF
jgi:hypothetical protein